MDNPTFKTVTPESIGVRSEDVIKFLEQTEKAGVYFHSFMLLKGNEIFAEGYRKPFTKDWLHRMYSTSKSFCAMAIGLLIDSGEVSLDDPVIKFFPEYDTDKLHRFVRETTVRDLLIMATPFNDTTYSARRPAYDEPNWLDTFFEVEPNHPAGTVFNYDTSGSYVLGCIVERLTGKDFLTYLKEKALCKTGFSENSWCVKAPEGYAWAGSGVECTLTDFARFTRLVMNKGEWNGEQLLPRDYVEAACSKQIDCCQDGFYSAHKGQGYGYQIWMDGENTYGFHGMGAQLGICMPDEDLIFVCHADTQGLPSGYVVIYDILWRLIKETFSKTPLAENKEAYNKLTDVLNNMKYPVIKGDKTNEVAKRINGVKYELEPNPMKMTDIIVELEEDCGKLKYHNAQGEKEIIFGIGKPVESLFPQDGYFGDTIGKDSGRRYKCIASGAWTDSFELCVKADIIDDYFGNLCIHIGFKGDEIGIYMERHAEWFLNEYRGFAGGKAVKPNV